jgi:hypothetical protein
MGSHGSAAERWPCGVAGLLAQAASVSAASKQKYPVRIDDMADRLLLF